MNGDTVGGTACSHTGKHRGCAGWVGHTTGIAGSLLNAEHTGTYLGHLVQGHLLVHTRLDDHLAQFGHVLLHTQVQYQLLT